jgi:hypothetical protein
MQYLMHANEMTINNNDKVHTKGMRALCLYGGGYVREENVRRRKWMLVGGTSEEEEVEGVEVT